MKTRASKRGLGTLERITGPLNFPTSLTFDDSGRLFLTESGLPLGGAPKGGRLLEIRPDGAQTCLLNGLRPPLNGVTFHEGSLWLAEGGNPGRISRFDLSNGRHRTVLDHLPGGGNYHTNCVAFGPDGKLYFGQGAATNSGIVGPDANHLAWLRRLPHPQDIPGFDVVLSGANVTIEGDDGPTTTGIFQPYGQPAEEGARMKGRAPCTAAVLRCNPDGTDLEVFAWGLRNPYGLQFLDDGRLIAMDLGINDRGSRPVGQVPDCLYVVEEGRWYGWPDYAAGMPVTDDSLRPARGGPPAHLLSSHAELGPVPKPLLTFPIHAAPTRMAVNHPSGDWWIALFGDKIPFTGPPGPRAGRGLARYEPLNGSLESRSFPEIERPIDLTFDPSESSLFVLDFGHYEMLAGGELDVRAPSGGLWKVTV